MNIEKLHHMLRDWDLLIHDSDLEQGDRLQRISSRIHLAIAANPSAPLVAVSNNANILPGYQEFHEYQNQQPIAGQVAPHAFKSSDIVDLARMMIEALPDDNVGAIRETLISWEDGIAAMPTTAEEAPQATPSDDSKVLAEVYDAALDIAAMYVGSHCVDGEMHANAILTSKRPDIRENGVVIDWPRATVEPLTDEQIDMLAQEYDCVGGCDAPRIHDFARALLATPPTSKVTPEIANLTDELDCMNRNYQALLIEHNALKATSKATEPQSDRGVDAIMAALRESTNEKLLSFSAKEMRGVLNLWNSEKQQLAMYKKQSTSKADTGEPALMTFDPMDGMREVYPSEAKQYRKWHGPVAWLFNPYTGDKRNAHDVGSDPTGLLIVAPGNALKSATPSTTKPESHFSGQFSIVGEVTPSTIKAEAHEQIDHRSGYQKLREFIAEFEIDTGEGCYVLTENERFVLEQFVLELMDNEDAAEFIEVRYVIKEEPTGEQS